MKTTLSGVLRVGLVATDSPLLRKSIMPPPSATRLALVLSVLCVALAGAVSALAQTSSSLLPLKVDVVSPHSVLPPSSDPPASLIQPTNRTVVHSHTQRLNNTPQVRLDRTADQATVPTAPPTQLSLTSPTITTGSFPGINEFMKKLSAGVTPPDTNVAASPSRVLEATNSGLRMTDSSGTKNERVASLAAFFGESSVLFDPRVVYDRNSVNPRFIVAALERFSSATEGANLLVAVSRSDQPASLMPHDWCTYRINVHDFDPMITPFPGNPGFGTHWGDFTRMGLGADALSIAVEEIPLTAEGVLAQALYVMNKTALEDNAAACPATPVFTFNLSATVTPGLAIIPYPVPHYTSPSSFPGTTNPAYVIANDYFASSTYTVWRVRNLGSGSPLVDVIRVPSDIALADHVLFGAKQPGSLAVLDVVDQRISGTAGLADGLWATHGVVCNVGGSDEEMCLAVVRLNVGQDATGSMTASITQEHIIGGSTDGMSFWDPAIAVDQNDRTILVFQASSPTTFLSTWYSTKRLTDVAYPAPSILTSGNCSPLASADISFRTGDFVGAFTAPDLASFWIAGERFTSTVGVSACDWETWVGNVK